ncbi:hypothetical protein [Clostridium sp. Cult3]|uniref:hypothetical protein n=1 Tax=Clostridium sp. Cult3 TaxID=2079004 RepID=UPI001F2E4AAB|nr:hypothetical protein [Clostridium sp. Cult3]MCF6461339.1 hypothetical protein [Clostridium sp. Cult3]
MFNKVRLPYIILGLGMGILLTSIIYILNPIVKYRDYTEEEIVTLASDLGMVFVKENIDSSINIQEQKVKLIVDKGDPLEKVSKKLFELGVVDNAEKFHQYAKDKGIDKKIRVGTYELGLDLEYDKILDILTKQIK